MLNIILFHFANTFIQYALHIFWLFMPQYYKLPLLASIMFTVYQQFSPRNADYMSHAYLQLVLLPHQIRFPRAMEAFLAFLIRPALIHMSDWTGVYIGRLKFGCDTYKSLTVGVFVRHVSV